jgi:Activator of Hsp90 ATPase homolog 1-like protein
VTLVLEDRGEQTAVSLQHGEFATEERLELHQGGWTDSFEKLERFLG